MKLCVFYHAVLGGARPINRNFALSIIAEQMEALTSSGLAFDSDRIIVGYRGPDDGAIAVRSLIPKRADMIIHPMDEHSEIPTLNVLRQWLPENQDYAVLYHHIKGVSYPDQPFYSQWRRCMQRACVWNWRACIARMETGSIDSTGAHWLTPQQYPGRVVTPFWGGTFWWATAKFLATLPPLPEPTWENRYEAESWIGKGPNPPRVWDQAPHWPAPDKCR